MWRETIMINKWVKIGECAVDSGTIMLVDPCYVLPDKVTKKGRIESHHGKDSYTYEKFLEDAFEGEKDLLPREVLVAGIAGTGVAVGGFGGDGSYPVYIKKDKNGQVREAKIKFF
jgi:hypothetical protein